MIRKNLVLQIQQTIRQDFRLQVGRVGQEVTVSGAAPLLNTESGEIGSVIPSRSIEQLPLNGRNFSQLGLLVPGTNPGAVGDIRVKPSAKATAMKLSAPAPRSSRTVHAAASTIS